MMVTLAVLTRTCCSRLSIASQQEREDTKRHWQTQTGDACLAFAARRLSTRHRDVCKRNKLKTRNHISRSNIPKHILDRIFKGIDLGPYPYSNASCGKAALKHVKQIQMRAAVRGEHNILFRSLRSGLHNLATDLKYCSEVLGWMSWFKYLKSVRTLFRSTSQVSARFWRHHAFSPCSCLQRLTGCVYP